MSKFTNRKGALRLYDSTATPFYLELIFDKGDFSGPLGIPKTEEILVLNRGVYDANAHYIEGSDARVMEPFEITFSALIEDTTITTYLLDWLEGNTVNSNTIVTTKADTQRARSVASPAFADTNKKCSNVEYFLDGSTDIVWHYNEVYFELSDQIITEGEEEVAVALKGLCYGTVTRDTEFTSGTNVKD
jgi:hypothetical protein